MKQQRGAGLNLAVATTGFMVNFWAWALIGPLGPGIKEKLGLSFAAQSLLVAVPVVVGSLGRIPVGALTDRYGARMMFPLVSLVTILPVLAIAWVQDSYPAMIVAGFFLGIGGTAFAVGVPHVSTWYPPARRGFAIGVFGIGMGGTARLGSLRRTPSLPFWPCATGPAARPAPDRLGAERLTSPACR
jgi:NNP family nitrate/nitrite transporter-like MFS transporter